LPTRRVADESAQRRKADHATFSRVNENPCHDVLLALKEGRSGFDRTLGLVLDEASPERVVGHLVIANEHRQLHGMVHGGVYSALVETIGSVGASLASPAGYMVLGLENTTSFLRAVKEGSLCATGVPLARGRRTQVWETRIEEQSGRLVATGRLRVLCQPSDSPPGQPAVFPDQVPR
jgi:1,4-dihydroxy-2-naphthoyl-CoA hydrolase